MTSSRKAYPSGVSDEAWALVAPYLTLLREDAGQREHSLRAVFNGRRYVVTTGAPWRWMPDDLPQAKRGFVLLPPRWVVERSFARATRVRRLVKVDERYPSTLADLHIVAFVCLMLKQAGQLAASS